MFTDELAPLCTEHDRDDNLPRPKRVPCPYQSAIVALGPTKPSPGTCLARQDCIQEKMKPHLEIRASFESIDLSW